MVRTAAVLLLAAASSFSWRVAALDVAVGRRAWLAAPASLACGVCVPGASAAAAVSEPPALSPQQEFVLRRGGTEPPLSSPLAREFGDGEYRCAACSSVLFRSADKLEGRTGWPTFADAAAPSAIRVVGGGPFEAVTGAELRCATCDGRVGERFSDGASYPGTRAAQTRRRYSVNGAALVFAPADGSEPRTGEAPVKLAAKQLDDVAGQGGQFKWRMADGGLRPI